MKSKRSRAGHETGQRADGQGQARGRAGDLPVRSRRRRVAFRLLAVVVVPLVLLMGCEGVLRLAGYGYSASFFRPFEIGGRSMWVENEQFGLSFFPEEIARSPAPVVMQKHKPEGTYRIFVLGESAALGDPRPAFGFNRYLEVLLRERFPDVSFEVVNTGVVAINSHVILPIARECARHQGDFWLVYLGNNEFIGPFGASTVFGSKGTAVALVRARLALLRTRVGQALVALSARLKGKTATPKDWAGLRMFVGNELAPDDPRRAVVYQSFRRNLEDVVDAGVHSGARVILSSAAVNLRDCPPFASLGDSTHSGGVPSGWKERFGEAVAALTNGTLTEALPQLRKAVSENPGFAEAAYRLAQAEMVTGDPASAAEHFRLARDEDALPLRLDSRLAAIAAEVGRRYADRGVRWIDASDVLGRDVPGHIPGQESFYEHVHLNFDGNYRLARVYAEAVEAALPTALAKRAVGPWADQALCEKRLGLTDWNRYAVLEHMWRRLLDAPYTSQLNSRERLQEYTTRLTTLKRGLTTASRSEATAVYQDAIKRFPGDHRLHECYAEYLEMSGDRLEAAAQWKEVRSLIPHHYSGWYQRGRLLGLERQFNEARSELQTALRIRPDLAEGHVELGLIAYAEGQPEEALRQYDLAARMRPGEARIQLNRANALAALKRRGEALTALREAIRMRSSLWEARYLLGVELGVDEKLTEAQSEFEAVIRLHPDHTLAHLNLGMILAQQRRYLEALNEFNETLRLDPTNAKAQQAVAMIKKLGSQGQ